MIKAKEAELPPPHLPALSLARSQYLTCFFAPYVAVSHVEHIKNAQTAGLSSSQMGIKTQLVKIGRRGAFLQLT